MDNALDNFNAPTDQYHVAGNLMPYMNKISTSYANYAPARGVQSFALQGGKEGMTNEAYGYLSRLNTAARSNINIPSTPYMLDPQTMSDLEFKNNNYSFGRNVGSYLPDDMLVAQIRQEINGASFQNAVAPRLSNAFMGPARWKRTVARYEAPPNMLHDARRNLRWNSDGYDHSLGASMDELMYGYGRGSGTRDFEGVNHYVKYNNNDYNNAPSRAEQTDVYLVPGEESKALFMDSSGQYKDDKFSRERLFEGGVEDSKALFTGNNDKFLQEQLLEESKALFMDSSGQYKDDKFSRERLLEGRVEGFCGKQCKCAVGCKCIKCKSYEYLKGYYEGHNLGKVEGMQSMSEGMLGTGRPLIRKNSPIFGGSSGPNAFYIFVVVILAVAFFSTYKNVRLIDKLRAVSIELNKKEAETTKNDGLANDIGSNDIGSNDIGAGDSSGS